MNMKLKLLICCLTSLCGVAPLSADEGEIRPVLNALTLQVGSGTLRDTYLTPLKYEGSCLTLQYERRRHLRHPLLSNAQTVTLNYMRGDDRNDNSESLAGRLRYRYALNFNLWHNDRWSFLLGPTWGAEAGFNYNLKLVNANNPATARLASNFGATAAAGLHYRLKGYRCRALAEVQAPLLGVAFMPEYGASYYETFYLDHSTNDVHCTSLHNQQDLDVRLTTDIPLAVIPGLRRLRTEVRLGVNYHIETMKINDITTRYSTFEAVVGWCYQQIPYHESRRALLSREPLEAW